MIKAIIFDFDGVLVESTHIKTEAFRKLFSEKTDRVEEIVDYHLKNMGISRYIKFKYFYENILKEPYSEDTEKKLGKKFSEIVIDKIKVSPLVEGVRPFLEKTYRDYLFFIASGTPQEELYDIVTSKRLKIFLKGVYGAPATKAEIIKIILYAYHLNNNEVVFVGDAESDKMAAEKTEVHFILRLTAENSHVLSHHTIKDLTELKGKIMEFDSASTNISYV